jgi:catechol 2,3-dioxygenase-like lactoylglutathione lyase family enzyme
MATVSVRYIVDDVDAAIAFYTERLGFGVEFNPPGFAVLSRGDLRLLLNEPGAGGAGQPMPDGRNPEPGGWNRIQLEVRTSATRSSAAEAASRSCLRTPPATPSNFSNPQVTEAAPHRCWTGAMRTSENTPSPT